jgi:hypothetical protein
MSIFVSAETGMIKGFLSYIAEVKLSILQIAGQQLLTRPLETSTNNSLA